jgi:hypothetical protein
LASTIINSSSMPTVQLGPVKFSRIAAQRIRTRVARRLAETEHFVAPIAAGPRATRANGRYLRTIVRRNGDDPA